MKSSRDGKPLADKAARKKNKSTLLEYIRSMRPSEELARSLEKVLEERKHIRLRMDSREPFLAKKPVGRSGLRDLSERHDEYLYGKKRRRGLNALANVTVSVPGELRKKMERLTGVNWSQVAREAFEETVRRKRMLEAAESMDRLREATLAPGWSGAREVRKWRDREKRPLL